MSNGNVVKIEREDNTIKKAEVINFPNIKLKKDGTPKQTINNSIKGKSKEVYPLKKREDIEAIKQHYRNRIDNASNNEYRQIAGRDLLAFVLGINIGLRASDLLKLTWNDIFNKDFTFKDGVRIQEKKTGKYKTFFLNQSAQNVITEYISDFSIRINFDKPNNYIFKSREGNKYITVDTLCISIKKAAKECGINQNIGTHSIRKTYGYWQLITHKGDAMFLTHLQNLFNHSSQLATLRYCGLENDQTRLYYNDVNL